jgi:chemotaxis protein CheC
MQTNLSETQIDALRETNNIGAGHAAIALSQMLGKKIMIAVTRSEIIPSEVFLKNMVSETGGPVVGIYLQTLGDIQGALFYMFKKDSSLKLSDMLLFRQRGETKFIDEKAQSALKETCNILTGAFFSVLGDMLELKVLHKDPHFAFDKPEIIMYSVCEEIFGSRQEKTCLATEFIESSSQVSGSFAFIPKDESMQMILEKLKAK